MRMEDIPGIEMSWINIPSRCEYYILRRVTCTDSIIRGPGGCICLSNGYQQRISISLRADYGYKV